MLPVIGNCAVCGSDDLTVLSKSPATGESFVACAECGEQMWVARPAPDELDFDDAIVMDWDEFERYFDEIQADAESDLLDDLDELKAAA